MKLNPWIMVRDSMAGSAAIRLSTRAKVLAAWACDVPGGKVTVPMIEPVSSLGTIPVGVVFMKKTSRTIEAPTSPKDSHFLWIKNTTRFL